MPLRYDSDEYRRWAARVMAVYRLTDGDRYKTFEWVAANWWHHEVENPGEVYVVIDKYSGRTA